MFSAPHSGFSRLMRWIKARNSAETAAGRPGLSTPSADVTRAWHPMMAGGALRFHLKPHHYTSSSSH